VRMDPEIFKELSARFGWRMNRYEVDRRSGKDVNGSGLANSSWLGP